MEYFFLHVIMLPKNFWKVFVVVRCTSIKVFLHVTVNCRSLQVLLWLVCPALTSSNGLFFTMQTHVSLPVQSDRGQTENKIRQPESRTFHISQQRTHCTPTSGTEIKNVITYQLSYVLFSVCQIKFYMDCCKLKLRYWSPQMFQYCSFALWTFSFWPPPLRLAICNWKANSIK